MCIRDRCICTPRYAPPRHELGAAYLRHAVVPDAPANATMLFQAQAVYNATLAQYPHDGWALLGMAQACHALGTKDCADWEAAFRAAWKGVDVALIDSATVAL